MEEVSLLGKLGGWVGGWVDEGTFSFAHSSFCVSLSVSFFSSIGALQQKWKVEISSLNEIISYLF